MPLPRTVTVWCADWSAVAADLDPERPAAVMYANRVVARTRAAAEFDVRRGQRRRQAQRACPQLEIVDHDADRDARRFEPLVRAVAELAPRLEIVAPGWLQLAARGPSRYFGGDEAFARRLVELVTDIEPATGSATKLTTGLTTKLSTRSAAGLGVGIGIADGQAAAAIAAHLATRRSNIAANGVQPNTAAPDGTFIVAPGETAEFLAPLPIGWLSQIDEVHPDLVELFARLGLRRCGDLAALSVADVVARFGAAGMHAHRLAAATDRRPLATADPPPDRRLEHCFDDPIEQLDTVVFIGKQLADELVESLRHQGRVCVRIEITIESEDAQRSQRLWYRDQGLTAPAIVERVRWQLEGWVSGRDAMTGGVVRVELRPDEIRADDGRQGGIWGGRSQSDVDAARAVVRISAIAGDAAVMVPEWVGGRLPAERYRWVPAGGADLEDGSDRLDRGAAPWPGAVTPSPTVMYDIPLPAVVLDRGGHQLSVDGRGGLSGEPAQLVIGSDRYRVAAWAGPWPIDQRWWDANRSRRLARMQLVTDTGEAFLVGIERREWGVLGAYR